MGSTKTVYGDSGKAHILVVDDNAMVLRNVKMILENTYSVAVAASATQAFMAIGKRKPDLILLDYEMPMVDGKAFFEMIMEEEELCDIPVVFLTGVADKDVVQQILALKPAGYMLKPVDVNTMNDVIAEVLGAKQYDV